MPRIPSILRGPANRVDSRARHPSASWQPNPARLRRRVADELAAEGARWPAFAAAVLHARGRRGLGPAEFARLAGITEDLLRRVEEGAVDPETAPRSLTELLFEPPGA